MKKVWVCLFLVMVAGSSALLAEDFRRFEFQPFGGFTASGGIPIRTEDDIDRRSVNVSSSFNLGANLAINLNELDAVEAHWQRQFTEGRLPPDLPFLSGRSTTFSLKIDQIHCNFLHHYRIADHRARPYVMAGLGVSTYYADSNGEGDSKSHFSFALGGGMKYFITSRFGFRAEARWSPAILSSSGSNVWCIVAGGAICRIDLRTAVQHQLHLTGGLAFRF